MLSSSFLLLCWPYNAIVFLSSSSCKSSDCWTLKHSTKHETISATLLIDVDAVWYYEFCNYKFLLIFSKSIVLSDLSLFLYFYNSLTWLFKTSILLLKFFSLISYLFSISAIQLFNLSFISICFSSIVFNKNSSKSAFSSLSSSLMINIWLLSF